MEVCDRSVRFTNRETQAQKVQVPASFFLPQAGAVPFPTRALAGSNHWSLQRRPRPARTAAGPAPSAPRWRSPRASAAAPPDAGSPSGRAGGGSAGEGSRPGPAQPVRPRRGKEEAESRAGIRRLY
uniref:Uncharacterized protein n=1 Tax=Pipistrellus kuhlii TaxID=59472 RepID=A0A7J7UA34_PIPKU|nr:hypothetical protein mPipKuh1_009131 [Pipistrellus kuhlii]